MAPPKRSPFNRLVDLVRNTRAVGKGVVETIAHSLPQASTPPPEPVYEVLLGGNDALFTAKDDLEPGPLAPQSSLRSTQTLDPINEQQPSSRVTRSASPAEFSPKEESPIQRSNSLPSPNTRRRSHEEFLKKTGRNPAVEERVLHNQVEEAEKQRAIANNGGSLVNARKTAIETHLTRGESDKKKKFAGKENAKIYETIPASPSK